MGRQGASHGHHVLDVATGPCSGTHASRTRRAQERGRGPGGSCRTCRRSEVLNRTVSIVIPTWNGREILERNLPSVEVAVTAFGGRAEIVVVDDGSRDGSAAWLEQHHPSVRVIARAANE